MEVYEITIRARIPVNRDSTTLSELAGMGEDFIKKLESKGHTIEHAALSHGSFKVLGLPRRTKPVKGLPTQLTSTFISPVKGLPTR